MHAVSTTICNVLEVHRITAPGVLFYINFNEPKTIKYELC